MPTERTMPMQTERMMSAPAVHGGMGTPNPFEGARSVIRSRGHRFFFTGPVVEIDATRSKQPDGLLEEITSVAIPYNSSQGLAGF